MAVGVTGARALPATTRVGMSAAPIPAAAGPSHRCFGHAVEQGQRQLPVLARSCKTARWPAVISGIVRHDGSAWPSPMTGPPGEPGGGATRSRRDSDRQWKESPQAQDPVAFGLPIVKPCFSMVSTKSIVHPPR